MKTLAFILILLAVVVGVAWFVMFRTESSTTPDRIMSVESYISQNISELSPEKEVLGGKFYVTSIEAGNGRGVVEYEDGHIALVEDFTYEISEETGIRITSFTIRR